MEPVNDYTYHQTMLADPGARLPVTESNPQPGRYRLRRNGEWRPVAIWIDHDGVKRVLLGNQLVDSDQHGAIWISCARHAISETEYQELIAGPVDDPVYARLPEEPEHLRGRVERLAAIPTSIENSDDARRLADVAHVLKQIEKTCDERQRELSAPHKEAIGAIRERWGVPCELAIAAREPVMRALATYLKGKNEPGGVKAQLGKAISLRAYKTVEITDLEAALAHFVKEDPEAFTPVVEKLARAAIKTGETPPGVREIEDRRAQ